MSRAIGRLADMNAPASVMRLAIERFCLAFDVDLKDAQVPQGGFDSFNAFFTRRLRDRARPIDDRPGALVSPADGVIEDCGDIDARSSLLIKDKQYSAAELLGDAACAERYRGGQFAIIYLSPRDYHRVHAPAGGPVTRVQHVPGTLYPVNSIGEQHIPNLFAVNERVTTLQLDPELGTVASVMVGAIGVGRIGLCFEDIMTNVGREPRTHVYEGESQPHLARGDELGVFYLGSTVVIFIEADRRIRFEMDAGSYVQVGQAIGLREPE